MTEEDIIGDEDGSENPTALTLGLPDIRTSRQRRWSRLESVDVGNFKAIEKAEVPLGDVTILVGPNGSGKSSVLQAIHWAARAASYIPPKSGKEMMSFDRIDYIPSSEPLRSAYRAELRPGGASKPTSVVFNHHASQGEEKASVEVKIFAARNGGGITAHIEGEMQSVPTSSVRSSSRPTSPAWPDSRSARRCWPSHSFDGRPRAEMPEACCATSF